MYEELIKRLRCLKYGNCPDCPMWYSEEVKPNLWRERCAAIDAADAIEELSAFREQILDGHFYCMRDGVLYAAKVEMPRGKTIQLPPIEFSQPPEEE